MLLYIYTMLYRIEVVGDCRHGLVCQKETKPSPNTMKQKDQRLSVLRSKKIGPPQPPRKPWTPKKKKKQNLISVCLLPRKSSQQNLCLWHHLTNHPSKPSKPTITHPIYLIKSCFFCSNMFQPKEKWKNGSSKSTSQGSPASMRGARGPLGCSGRPGRPLAARRSEILRWVLASEKVRGVGERTTRNPPLMGGKKRIWMMIGM